MAIIKKYGTQWALGWTYQRSNREFPDRIKHFVTVGEIRADGTLLTDIDGIAHVTAGGLML